MSFITLFDFKEGEGHRDLLIVVPKKSVLVLLQVFTPGQSTGLCEVAEKGSSQLPPAPKPPTLPHT